MKKVFKGIIRYLSDWRNWLAHALLGIVLLCLMIFLPVDLWVRLCLMAAVIAFNIIRMRRSRKS